jgi:hypothetical protein
MQARIPDGALLARIVFPSSKSGGIEDDLQAFPGFQERLFGFLMFGDVGQQAIEEFRLAFRIMRDASGVADPFHAPVTRDHPVLDLIRATETLDLPVCLQCNSPVIRVDVLHPYPGRCQPFRCGDTDKRFDLGADVVPQAHGAKATNIGHGPEVLDQGAVEVFFLIRRVNRSIPFTSKGWNGSAGRARAITGVTPPCRRTFYRCPRRVAMCSSPSNGHRTAAS